MRLAEAWTTEVQLTEVQLTEVQLTEVLVKNARETEVERPNNIARNFADKARSATFLFIRVAFSEPSKTLQSDITLFKIRECKK